MDRSQEFPKDSGPGRREFLKRVGAAGLVASLPPAAAALAQGTPAAKAPAPATPAAPDAPSREAVALAAILEARYGDRLSAAQWESVARDFDGDLGAGKRLHATKLANGVEPDTTFRA